MGRNTEVNFEEQGRLRDLVPKAFPDPATCCVKKAGVEDFFECLSFWSGFCPHVLIVDFGARKHFCNHQTKPEIYSRSQDRPPSSRSAL